MPFPLKYPFSPNDQRSVTFGNPILLFFYLSLFLSILLVIDIVVNYSLAFKKDNYIKNKNFKTKKEYLRKNRKKLIGNRKGGVLWLFRTVFCRN